MKESREANLISLDANGDNIAMNNDTAMKNLSLQNDAAFWTS